MATTSTDAARDRDDVERGAGATRRRLRRVLLGAIALLYVASVPWYRSTGGEVRIVFGLPDWVAVALGCYVGVALLNSAAWLLSEVRDDDGGPPP